MYIWSQGRSTKAKSVDRDLSCILGVTKRDVFWGLPNMYPESYDCGLPGHFAVMLDRVPAPTASHVGLTKWGRGTSLAVMRAAMMEPGVHTMSDELILQISCNIFLAFNWILMMTSGQNISHYTAAKPSVHVWNHDLIWWQNKIDTQKHFHKTWSLSKTQIPITIVKAQIPSNPNQKSRTRDNERLDSTSAEWKCFRCAITFPDNSLYHSYNVEMSNSLSLLAGAMFNDSVFSNASVSPQFLPQSHSSPDLS